jgi:hypothetical protein
LYLCKIAWGAAASDWRSGPNVGTELAQGLAGEGSGDQLSHLDDTHALPGSRGNDVVYGGPRSDDAIELQLEWRSSRHEPTASSRSDMRLLTAPTARFASIASY